jgi:diguanylate cyclase (GGDEF)-like protein/PAS domain S-box-containing protein
MWLRVLLAGISFAVVALVVVVADDARRDADAHRRAQIAAERLDASLHEIASLEDRSAGDWVDLTALAHDLGHAVRRGRAAARRLTRLRPRDPSARAAMAAGRRHARAASRRVALIAEGRPRAARRLDDTALDSSFEIAARRIHAMQARLAREADAAYDRGGAALMGGVGVGLLLLIAVGATYAGASRRAALARSERRRAAVAERMSDVIALVDPDGTVRWQSASGARLLAGDAPLVGAPVGTLFDADGAALAHEMVARLLDQPGAVASFTACATGPDGETRSFETLVENRLRDGDIRALVLTSRDVTDRVRLEEELRRRALQEELTGLPNRALFEDRLQHALAAARRGGRIAVLFVDLDDFKTVNDSLGHAAGDELLRVAAGRIDEVLRAGDTVARMGGDEFAVLLERIAGADEPELIAQRLLERLRAPVTLGGRRLVVRASVGIALSQPAAAPGDLLRDADVAMYAAKTRGDGGWARFDPAMHAQAVARLELSAELPAAIERSELELQYEPIVGLDGEPVGGAEALVRWRHPRRGLLAPGAFIGLAEGTGAIVPLGRWVLAQACRDVARWQREAGGRPLFVSVNVSHGQLADDAVVEHVREALDAAGVAPTSLMLEITESLFANDAGDAVRRLRELRALGVRTAIDDFGTGHSALASLRRLPVDVLKIDRSFVEELTSHPDSRKVLAGVVQLGRSLDLEIIAEGVERPDQARELAALGAMSAQGFLYARPMPADELEMAPHLGMPRRERDAS